MEHTEYIQVVSEEWRTSPRLFIRSRTTWDSGVETTWVRVRVRVSVRCALGLPSKMPARRPTSVVVLSAGRDGTGRV